MRTRFLLTFLCGVLAAVLANGLAGIQQAAASRYDDLSLFSSVLDLVRRHYVEPVDERELIKGAVRGLLSELDPHSSFMDADAYSEMQVDTKGEFHGLGIEITKRKDGFIEVVSPIDGTPASRAGVKAKDQIVAICPELGDDDEADASAEEGLADGEGCRSTKGMTLFEAVKLMRGPKGSSIRIQIFREGFELPQPFTVTRDVVQVKSVSGELLEPGYAYLRIRSFQERTANDLESILAELHGETERSFDGLVLDMRDNPGGLLDQAVRVADFFLEGGLVVYTQGRVESQRQEFRAQADGTEPHYPIAILVNEGTASASEIVAGALQDQSRALVIGQKTFGKGSVQTVYPLESQAGLRLTTALYYTPSGRSIQEVGIEPDIPVRAALAKLEAPAEPQRRRLRERDLEGHITQDDAREDGESGETVAGSPKRDDLQLARALEVLKSWTYFDRLRLEGSSPLRAAAEAEGDEG